MWHHGLHPIRSPDPLSIAVGADPVSARRPHDQLAPGSTPCRPADRMTNLRQASTLIGPSLPYPVSALRPPCCPTPRIDLPHWLSAMKRLHRTHFISAPRPRYPLTPGSTPFIGPSWPHLPYPLPVLVDWIACNCTVVVWSGVIVTSGNRCCGFDATTTV